MKYRFPIFILFVFCHGCFSIKGAKENKTGKADPDQIQTDFKWFENGYRDYHPDETAIAKLRTRLPLYRIIIFAGTWCPDTQRILPGFYKAIDEAGYPREHTTLYLLDKKMRSAEKLEEKYHVHSVPTFIILKNEEEAGRIVENPKANIETDFANIVR
jgi:hypothetical protein